MYDGCGGVVWTGRQPPPPPPLRIYAVFKNKRAGVFRKERAPSSRVRRRRRRRLFDNSWPTRPRVRPSSYRPDIANAPTMAIYYIIILLSGVSHCRVPQHYYSSSSISIENLTDFSERIPPVKELIGRPGIREFSRSGLPLQIVILQH